MKLDELFGFLKTFELNLNDEDSKKRSGIDLQAINQDTPQPSKKGTHVDSLPKSIVFFTEQIWKLQRQFHKRSSNFGAQSNRDFGSSSASSSSSSSSYAAHKHRDIDKGDRNSVSYKSDRSFRSYECESFEHYQAECSTFLKEK